MPRKSASGCADPPRPTGAEKAARRIDARPSAPPTTPRASAAGDVEGTDSPKRQMKAREGRKVACLRSSRRRRRRTAPLFPGEPRPLRPTAAALARRLRSGLLGRRHFLFCPRRSLRRSEKARPPRAGVGEDALVRARGIVGTRDARRGAGVFARPTQDRTLPRRSHGRRSERATAASRSRFPRFTDQSLSHAVVGATRTPSLGVRTPSPRLEIPRERDIVRVCWGTVLY